MSSGQQAIADYFREQAAWRGEKVAEYPDDDRNQRCADGLEELADYVLSLPADDARIIELTTLGVREGLFILPPSDSAERAVSRFRLDRGAEDCGRFLDSLVRMMRDDAIRQAQFAGELEVD